MSGQALPRVTIVMGVSGSGKTLIGGLLAERFGATFVDADALHPPENRAKMSAGVPLTDDDRRPWLERVRREVVDGTPPGSRAVLACSALKRRYREFLSSGARDVRFVYLYGPLELIHSRMAARKGHFMPLSLLESQFATLEVPSEEEALRVSVAGTPEEIVAEIAARLGGESR